MRKMLVVSASALVLLAACGGGSKTEAPDTTAAPATSAAGGDAPDTASTESGGAPKPEVKAPEKLPTELVITDLKAGSGDKAKDGDTVLVRYVGVRSRDGVEFDNNYDSDLFPVQIGAGGVIKGWDQGLVGVQAGTQRQLDIPAALAYGEQSQGDIIGPNEALTFVIDVYAVIPPTDPATEPVVSVSPSKVAKVEVVDLVDGTGATAVEGQTIIFDYLLYRGDTGEKLFSSWTESPATVELVASPEDDPTTQELVKALIGLKIGGRRQITLPGSLAFGGGGNPDIGLPAGTDVVIVAELRATY